MPYEICSHIRGPKPFTNIQGNLYLHRGFLTYLEVCNLCRDIKSSCKPLQSPGSLCGGFEISQDEKNPLQWSADLSQSSTEFCKSQLISVSLSGNLQTSKPLQRSEDLVHDCTLFLQPFKIMQALKSFKPQQLFLKVCNICVIGFLGNFIHFLEKNQHKPNHLSGWKIHKEFCVDFSFCCIIK